MAENLEKCDKKLRDFGAKRIIQGHRNRCPLTSVELIDLYMTYLNPRNRSKIMTEHEFECFCCDFKKLIPRQKNEKLRGTGYLALKEDLIGTFKNSRGKFNCCNKRMLEKACSRDAHRDDPNNYEIKLKDDEIGLEDFARIVCVEQNFLLRHDLRKYFNGTEKTIPKEVCEMIFQHYDQNGSAWLSQSEIMGLLRDIFSIQRMKEEMTGRPISTPKEITELMEYTDEMCIKFSTNLDGMLTYGEMENLLNKTQSKK